MKVSRSSIALSSFEEHRFGIVTARSFVGTGADVEKHVEFCKLHGARLLIARCSTSDVRSAQALERRGALLMDCLVYYRRDFERSPLGHPSARTFVRKLALDDAPGVGEVARQAFAGYRGHYHSDDRIDSALADVAYSDWALRSCSDPQAADVVFVATEDDVVVGFIAIKRIDEDEADIVLNGVLPRAQGRGFYSALFERALRWTNDEGMRRCIISTQIDNIAVQKVWVRNGMEPFESVYTFHLWLDER